MKRQDFSDKPNIVLINCDDLGYGDLGCYGSERNDTPKLDQMAREGIRFTNFYSSAPACTASRASLMTGCYSQRIGFGDNPVLSPGDAEGLNPSEKTIARQLKEAGYATKIIGKWHCGDQPEYLPTKHGFDEYFGIPFSNDMGRQVNHPTHPPLPLMRNAEVCQQQPDQRGLSERYVDEALQFIRRKQDEPFFLYLAHMYVHVPLFVPARFMRQSRNGGYGGAVAAIDWAFAMLDFELERLGLHENTLVIFTSDNGSRARNEGGSNGPLRGVKAETWEGGFRLPCIMRWPGKIAAGSECHGIASHIDIFATLAEITGTDIAPERKLDSLSLAGVILRDEDSPRTTMAYYWFNMLEAVREGKWKLHFYKSSRVPEVVAAPISELYNLEEDVGETTNVYDQYPEVVARLNAVAEQFRNELGDSLQGRAGSEVRPIGRVDNPQPLTFFDENYPYIEASYDLADMPTMSG